MTELQLVTRKPRALFICGSRNQTTQLLAVARSLPELSHAFTPYYGTRMISRLIKYGFARIADSSILGRPRREACLRDLEREGVAVDLDGARAPYDLVVTCSDLVMPANVRGARVVLVQEGMTERDNLWSRWVARAQLPPWVAMTTATTGLSRLFDRFCVASEGYREFFAARGVPHDLMRVTGIPNFDDCASYCVNDQPERGYVLACTSDLRETYHRDDRRAFLERVKRIAAGRPTHVKLHPNERIERARREIQRYVPGATIHTHGSAETLIANCDVLVTQVSSVVFVGIALGKVVYSDFDIAELRKLCPVQNGGRSAQAIADVCRDLLAIEPAGDRVAESAGRTRPRNLSYEEQP